jgi:hypothetical protein
VAGGAIDHVAHATASISKMPNVDAFFWSDC